MNFADSQRIGQMFTDRGYQVAPEAISADVIVINTCIVRQSAENRVYGLINNLSKWKNKEIILTGCLAGWALKDPVGGNLKSLRKKIGPSVRIVGIEELAGLHLSPLRTEGDHAWVPISNGCNNFCAFCIVPQARGREVSRPWEDILREIGDLSQKGYSKITLLGQNVNSYGADLAHKKLKKGSLKPKIALVKQMGRPRLPTLFPFLLEAVAKIPGLKVIDFMSSNPWDFSDELIRVIAKYPQITRVIHLPVQSGDDEILRKMNRGYTAKEYLELVGKIKKAVEKAEITTDIIVGFPGETKAQFENTLKLCQQVGFKRAFIGRYSPRPGTLSAKLPDSVSHQEKKRRWRALEKLVNRGH